MDNCPVALHNLITDGETPQVLLLCECDILTAFKGNFYCSLDGDMSSNGASFTDQMTAGEGYSLGCVPSRTMNVSIMNQYGYLNGHNFGWVQAYIGARYGSVEYAEGSGENCRLVYNSTFYGKTDGFYDGATKVQSGNCVGLYSMTDGYVYFFMESGGIITAYSYKTADSSVSSTDIFSEAMLYKFSVGIGVRINGNGWYYRWENGLSDGYYLACLGHFRVDKPKKTLGKTIEITDAFDAMHELEVDASLILATSTASDGYHLLFDLARGCGLWFGTQYVSEIAKQRLSALPVDLVALQENSYSCRRLVSYICEAIGCNARVMLKTRYLYVYAPYESIEAKEYPVTANRIASNGIEVEEYSTKPIDAVSVKSLENATEVYPSQGGESVYEFSGNPFVNTANSTLFTYIRQIPTYTPMTVEVIEADPSFQCGDIIEVSLNYNEDEELLTYDGDDITTYAGEDILVNPSQGKWALPLLSQTIKFNGKCSATYEISGNDRLEYTGADYYTDVNARVTAFNRLYTNHLIINNHSSDVGTIEEKFIDSDKSLTANTQTEVTTLTLSPGVWIINGFANFKPTTGSGKRTIGLSTQTAYFGRYTVDETFISSEYQRMAVSCVANITTTTTYYLNAYSTTACDLHYYFTGIQAVRLT